VSDGLMPDSAPGLRVAGGVQLPQLSLELDARWLPLWKTRPLGVTESEMHTFAMTAAGCLKRPPLLGCLFVAGGAIGSTALNRAFEGHIVRGFFGVGARSGVALPFTEHLAARVDVEVALVLLGTHLDLVRPSFWESVVPTFTGGGMLVYTF
jgi:hypothetical protein